MTNWTTVFVYEIRQKLRSKGYLFITFALPLLAIVAFFGYQAIQNRNEDDKPLDPITEQQDNNNRIYGYVDETPEGLFPAPDSYDMQPEDCRVTEADAASGSLPPDLIKRITSPYCMQSFVHHYATYDEGEQALKDEQIDVLYVIEPDYVNSGNVSVYLATFDIEMASESRLFEDYMLASLLHNVEPEAYSELYLRLRDPAVITDHRVAESGAAETENDNQNFALVYGFGLTMMLGIFWGGGYLMQSVVQEKESRIVEIILSSVAPTPLLLGKTMAMGLLALLQTGVLVGTFVFLGSQAGDVFESLGDIEVAPDVLVLMMLYFLLGFLFFGGLMAAVGALSTTMRESQNLVPLVTLPATIPFFLLVYFAEEPHSTVAVALSIVPVTAPLSMIMRLAVTDVPAGELILSLGVLVLSVVFVIWLAGRLFRVNILLMGNMPKLRDIPRLIRG